MLTCAPHVPSYPVKVRSGVRPVIRLNHLQSNWFDFHGNVKCKMLRSVIHFDTLLRFGANTQSVDTRWPFSEFGWAQARYWF